MRFGFGKLLRREPQEPMGLGAVVRDGDGDVFVRALMHDSGAECWAHGAGAFYRWAELPHPVTVLNQGYLAPDPSGVDLSDISQVRRFLEASDAEA